MLTYHVNYWDRPDWNDPFSQAAFTARQREYAQQFSGKSVYTPQVVINGQKEFLGSNEQRLRSTLKQYSGVTAFAVKVQPKTASAVTFSYNIKPEGNALISIALIQPQATTEIKRGENSGPTLQHVNVVRQLTVNELKAGDEVIEILIPASLQTAALKAILFFQQKKDKRITAAAGADIPLFMDVKSN